MARTCRLAAILAADVAGYSRPMPPLCSALWLKSSPCGVRPRLGFSPTMPQAAVGTAVRLRAASAQRTGPGVTAPEAPDRASILQRPWPLFAAVQSAGWVS
jgi:hypothetical protein